MHEFTPQKAKFPKHAREKYQYLESLSHQTYICKVWEVQPVYVKICIFMEIRALLITFHQMFGRHTISESTFDDVPFWPHYSTDKFISCVVPGPSQWFFQFGEEIVITWTQEKTTTLGGTEPHHSSWQCKESHRGCCHGPLAPLAMGDSGTSTLLTRFESMRLRSLRQSERTTARDPVQYQRWLIRSIGRSIWNINEDRYADGVWRLPKIW